MSIPIETHIYVNVYQAADGTLTAQSAPTLEIAELNQEPPGGWPTSTKKRIARLRVPVVCVAGQFDL